MRALKQSATRPSLAAGMPRRRLLGDMAQDLGYAARMLRKNPGFAARW